MESSTRNFRFSHKNDRGEKFEQYDNYQIMPIANTFFKKSLTEIEYQKPAIKPPEIKLTSSHNKIRTVKYPSILSKFRTDRNSRMVSTRTKIK